MNQMNSRKESDIYFIKKCFTLAKRGAGNVSPNPLVGSVIVKNDEIIGRGWHKKYGAPHAEALAIQNAKENLNGATLYCNLEPCCHTNKQTPPCVPLIISKKIKRVVISNLDPNREVNGKGVRQLRNAGIKVTTEILKDEGEELNKFYFKYLHEKIPFITLKIAQSIDGKISLTGSKQTWITGKESIRFVHKLRSEYDAVMVGAGTVKADNPLLTVREVKGSNPLRIIIDGNLSIPLRSKVLDCDDAQNSWIFTSKNVANKKINAIKTKGATVYQVNQLNNNRLNLKSILKILSKQKITSLLVEGGADIFTQFIQKDLFDEIIIIQAPKILGAGISSQKIEKLKKLRLIKTSRLGEDIKLIYRK